MTQHVNFNLTDLAHEAWESRGGNVRGNGAAVLNRMLERHAEAMRSAEPDLSDDEWGYLNLAFRGVEIGAHVISRMNLMAHLMAHSERFGYGTLGEDGFGDLMATIQAGGRVECIALLDTVERYWVRMREESES